MAPIPLPKLLAKTSRTFDLAIRLLPNPLREQVSLAYLLLRVADTLEDARLWPAADRVAGLALLERIVIRSPHPDATELAERASRAWIARPPTTHAGYLELLGQLPALIARLTTLTPIAARILTGHVRRSIAGMIHFQTRGARPEPSAHDLALANVADVRSYCYVVAGIVGELLTDLFVANGAASAEHYEALTKAAASFGEGLQLVNILKDEADDRAEGRVFVPSVEERRTLFALAEADLDVAETYVAILRRANASVGVVAFTALPLRLARATLSRLRERGAGAKLTRDEVQAHLRAVGG